MVFVYPSPGRNFELHRMLIECWLLYSFMDWWFICIIFQFVGCFSTCLGMQNSVFSELMGAILVIKIAVKSGWRKIWLKCDSRLVVQAFRNHSIVPWRLRNKWLNCINATKNMFFFFLLGTFLEKATLEQMRLPLVPILFASFPSAILSLCFISIDSIGINMACQAIDSNSLFLQGFGSFPLCLWCWFFLLLMIFCGLLCFRVSSSLSVNLVEILVAASY